jgi:predicted nucleic-acid-binding protein
MITIDTNILVRMLVFLDSEQAATIRRLAARHTLIILPTVFIETEWVLRSVVKVEARRINEMFSAVLDTDGIEVPQIEKIRSVLDLHRAGMDFADAMHLCLTDEATTFVTFDRDLVKGAKKHMPNASVELADTL